jgi:hypothetical protein
MLYVSWRELSELDAPDGRDDIAPYLSLVGGVCAGPNTSPDAVVEPPIQALPDTYVLVIEDEPAVSVSYGLFVDGGRVICFAEGRIGYREWARRNGRLGDEIHSMDDRYDHDIDELMA